jgi:hypothetical protein
MQTMSMIGYDPPHINTVLVTFLELSTGKSIITVLSILFKLFQSSHKAIKQMYMADFPTYNALFIYI